MIQGLKISKPGDDVRITPSKDLAFDSARGALKIYRKGTITLTTDASGNGIGSATHNMNYAPAFFVFRKATAKWSLIDGVEHINSYFPIGAPNYYVKDDLYHHAIHSYTDGSNIYVQVAGGKPNTPMSFTYALLVDQSEQFSNADGIISDPFGLKIAKSTFDVKTAKEYQLGFSTQYKILQHYKESNQSGSLTYQQIFASYVSDYVQQVSYIDFNHGLGYPPIFIAYAQGQNATGNQLVKLPFAGENSIDVFNTSVSGFADATKIRIYWWRSSTFFNGALLDNRPTDTLLVEVCAYTESLAV